MFVGSVPGFANFLKQLGNRPDAFGNARVGQGPILQNSISADKFF
jgi:hypothetical protein